MRKNSIMTFLLMFLSCALFAQQRTDEEAVRAVADNILKQPVTQFVGVSNGVVYNSTAEIPEGEDVK
ncbi:MAG: glycosyl hydrolase, partial [Fermentimonas sp.]|nr:glycosyl hydrolase [Fermentimonas sp.]MDD4009799.1 glycosyl hydrolase [Fermentimonas sp.]MDD4697732.1 glycosyl hydrolase [Fermentimonas sp.]